MAIGSATSNKVAKLRADVRALAPESNNTEIYDDPVGSPVWLITKLTIAALTTAGGILMFGLWMFQGSIS
jgi:hypothetical protein